MCIKIRLPYRRVAYDRRTKRLGVDSIYQDNPRPPLPRQSFLCFTVPRFVAFLRYRVLLTRVALLTLRHICTHTQLIRNAYKLLWIILANGEISTAIFHTPTKLNYA